MGRTLVGRRAFVIWVGANAAGWLLGVVVVLVLSTLEELTHFGNMTYVGLGMGGSVGFAQWLIARKWFGATARWMWATAIGMTLPFLLVDLMRVRDLNSFLLSALAAIGGLLAGWMQRNSLQSLSSKANRWVIVSGVAWMCPALLVELVIVPGHPKTILDSVRNIGSIGFGGVVLGVITGLALASPLNARERQHGSADPPLRNTKPKSSC